MKKTVLILLISIIFLAIEGFSQAQENKGLFSWLPAGFTAYGYLDSYFSYDTDRGEHLRKFSSTAPYRDEFRINMVLAGLRYQAKRVRATLGIHFGDISTLNWPQGPYKYLKYIQEANGGFSPGKNIWIDGGYFLTHIGAEATLPKDNFFQTLSLCTYYQPFFQSGLRLSYTAKKFYGALFALHGYNLLIDNNKNKSFGIQAGYILNKKTEIVYNNIAGNEMPAGTPGKLRIFNDLVVKINPSKKLNILMCGDFCIQEKSKLSDPSASAKMFSGFISMRYKLRKRVSISVRGEYIQDNDGIMSGTFINSDSIETGLKAAGVTLGFEFNPLDNAYVRLEGRYLMTDSKLKIFFNSSNNRVEAILSGGIWF